MPKFGGFNSDDLKNLERTADTAEGDTYAHPSQSGMRFGGRDETSQHQTVTRIDHLEGRVVEHIKENLIPRIAEHSRISIKTDRVQFLYYQKLLFGRRCSCWNSTDSVADKRCPVCFGTGYPSGYRKYGTEWHTIDTTFPRMTLVNVVPDYDSQVRPVPLTLMDVPKGYIEVEIQLSPNTGVLDMMRLGGKQPSGSKLTPLVKRKGESSFVELNKENIESRLSDGFGRPNTLVFRIEMTRASEEAGLPNLTFLHFRYRTHEDISVFADIPQREESVELQEYGLQDAFDTIEMILPRNLTNIRTEDFFIKVKSSERFKVIRRNQWTPEEVLVETSIRARHVDKEESLFKVP